MSDVAEKIAAFVEYWKRLSGDEKGEAQVFCDRLFQAFGHAGYKEAGATLEERIKRGKGKGTKFADLIWRPRLLLEMKKRGENLFQHYTQARDYWLEMQQKPRYVVLCNFDEFLIYDMIHQMDDPVDRVSLEDLPQRFTALNFLFPVEKKPLFGNDRVAVTRIAADKVAKVFNSLIDRGEDRDTAQRFVLQCVVALFAEDIDLLPRGLFTELIDRCKSGEDSSYDAFDGLFRQMNREKPARAGKFKGVPYFNGGLFEIIEPIELTPDELDLLFDAANENWAQVKPPIFGTLFESSMDQKERHSFGAHFTSELDIMKVVLPTIVRPWKKRIEAAKTLNQLITLRNELVAFRVLDPACGSGNFLYVAYREMKRLEMQIVAKVHENFGAKARQIVGGFSLLTTSQFFGIDVKEFAVELAKVTLMLAKKLALDETKNYLENKGMTLPLDFDQALPLDNLNDNIICSDALFCDWPESDAIIGNPPYQSKNKMQQELGADYIGKIRERFPDVPGRADYCVYWFRRAHDELPKNGRAGLVGTNTIRQNYSREGSLDIIVNSGGTITEAVSSQVWSGDAVVHVSIVNWVKGSESGKKKLFFQIGDHKDSPWEEVEIKTINSSLSKTIDLTPALPLSCNVEIKSCYQGQTHGHAGFLFDIKSAKELLSQNTMYRDVLFPFLTGRELVSSIESQPCRYVLDFHPRDIFQAKRYDLAYKHVEKSVLPARQKAAKEESERNERVLSEKPNARVNRHHHNFLNKWWLPSYPREELIQKLSKMTRYIACARVTRRQIFEFVSAEIRPNDKLQVFAFEDDYSFGIISSKMHWNWFISKCTTLKADYNYNAKSIWETFPWPQSPTLTNVRKVAKAAVALRKLRRQIMTENEWSLRDLYRTLETPGKNPLRDAHDKLDTAVRAAYGMQPKADPLAFLLKLNHDIAKGKIPMTKITSPGLPMCVKESKEFVTTDCVRV